MSPAARPNPTPSLFGEEPAETRRAGQRAAAKVRAPAPERPPLVADRFAQVALNRPIDCEFTYGVPVELEEAVAVGARVAVPFGRRREVGVVTALLDETDVDPRKLRAIARVLDREPLLDAHLCDLARWVGARYACSVGEALAALLPSALKREKERARVLRVTAVPGVGATELAEIEEAFPKQHRLLRTLLELDGPIELSELTKRLNLSDSPARTLARRGWIRIERVAASADPLDVTVADRPRPERLLPDQQFAVAALTRALDDGVGASFLLHGVTGSGKTEVYLAAIERALALGRGAIVLVPEIALTPQTVGWFRARFDRVAVLHSRMTDVQRLEAWQSIRRGEVRVVVGARSAVFAPVPALGIVVVDEEHEPSFKQGSTPRYHARDVAIERARSAGAVCVLGSATPSLETWSAAEAGRIRRVSLPERASGRPLPPVEVVDMREQTSRRGGLFSPRLAQLLKRGVLEGEQSILFLNRRGFAPVLWCPGCKETLRCEHCDVSLSFHRRIKRLVCHSCCEELAPPTACPACTFPQLRYLGAGSERIEAELGELLPDARVARMDSDTMRRREDYERVLGAFGAGELDVLVGTQMIAKGLDFPRVTLVGIVDADVALHLPEFRAAERTFQLIAQVAGRAGRGELEGRIVVQTITPDHPAVQHASRHDFKAFAQQEDRLRAELAYPPHGRVVRALFEDTDLKRTEEAAAALGRELREALRGTGAVVLGPAPAPFSMLRGRHRQHLLIKLPLDGAAHERALIVLRARAARGARPRLAIDVDPVGLL